MIELTVFFEKKIEQEINDNLFLRNYHFDEKKVVDYINELTNVPIRLFFDYITSKELVSYLAPTSVVQYSSITDATTKICSKFEKEGDEGYDVIEIGRMLLDDGNQRKDGAYRKYGENHVKLALEFGLVQECYDHYYLTCLGKVFSSLDTETQTSLLSRTILRNNFIQRLIKLSSGGQCSIVEQLSFLSDSTIKRRVPNIKGLFQLIRNDGGYVDDYLNNIAEIHRQSTDSVTEQIDVRNHVNAKKENDSVINKESKRKAEKTYGIENVNLIREEMEAQNKGLQVMSKLTGLSAFAIAKARDGGNATVDTLGILLHELGLKLTIVRDESVKPESYQRKKRTAKSGVSSAPFSNEKFFGNQKVENAVKQLEAEHLEKRKNIKTQAELIEAVRNYYLAFYNSHETDKQPQMSDYFTVDDMRVKWYNTNGKIETLRLDVFCQTFKIESPFYHAVSRSRKNIQSEQNDSKIASASDIIPYLVIDEIDKSINAEATAEAAGLLYANGWFIRKNGIQICRVDVLEKLAEIYTNDTKAETDENKSELVEDTQPEIFEQAVITVADLLPFVILNKDKKHINRSETAKAAGLSYANGWFYDQNGDKICRVEEIEELAGICTTDISVHQDDNTLQMHEESLPTITKATDILPYVVLNKDKRCINRKSTARAAGLSYAKGWFHNLNGDKICRVEDVDKLVDQHIDSFFQSPSPKLVEPPKKTPKDNDDPQPKRLRNGKYDLLKYALENYFKDKTKGTITGKKLQDYLNDWADVDQNDNITFKKIKRSLSWWCSALNVFGSPYYRKN